MKSLERKAKAAERAWLKSLPPKAAKSIPAEHAPNRAEARAAAALAQSQTATDPHLDRVLERGRRKADDARASARDDERLRDRSRRRSLRHLDAGLSAVKFVIEPRAELDADTGQPIERMVMRAAKPDDENVRVGVVAKTRFDESGRLMPIEARHERVTPELERDAAALRTLFNVEAVEPDTFPSQTTPAWLVPLEVANAIRAAKRALEFFWREELLDLVCDALAERHERARNKGKPANADVPPWMTPTTASHILRTLKRSLARMSGLVELPAYVDEACVVWCLATITMGRGGGRTGKLSVTAMRDALSSAEALKLARARGQTRTCK